MVTVTYVDPAGGRHEVRADEGASVMSTATTNGVPGIVAECGGFMSCASCHVYVDEEWIGRVGGPASSMESEMLEWALADLEPGSRLSCQIPISKELDGLLVRVAPEQL